MIALWASKKKGQIEGLTPKNLPSPILGDPGAVSWGEGKSKQA